MVTVDALAEYTQGRLDADADETAAILDRSLAEVRRWCGWHVTPVKTADQITLDGPGGTMLWLPTLYLSAVTAITEDGNAVSLNDVEWSATGMIRKTLQRLWTEKLRGITVTFNHGYATAPDFDNVVLSVADRKSQAPTGGPAVGIGPFRFSENRPVTGSPFTVEELAVLHKFRLDSPA